MVGRRKRECRHWQSRWASCVSFATIVQYYSAMPFGTPHGDAKTACIASFQDTRLIHNLEPPNMALQIHKSWITPSSREGAIVHLDALSLV